MKRRVYAKTDFNEQLLQLREDLLCNSHDVIWKRVAHCKAWFTVYKGYFFLKSYNTIVAMYESISDTIYSYGRYSNTTYQHVRKFRNNVVGDFRTREINLEYDQCYTRNRYYC